MRTIYVVLGICAMSVGCQEMDPSAASEELGASKSPLLAQYYVSGNSGSISFPMASYPAFARLTYSVRVDTPELNPLLANSCNLRLTSTAVTGAVVVQTDRIGFYDGSIGLGSVTSGIFAYEHDQATYGDTTVEVLCNPGPANGALYTYQLYID